jgi:glycosyltransferase 2 family protein
MIIILQAAPLYLALACIVCLVTLLVMTVRWRILIGPQAHFSFLDALRAVAKGMTLGVATPGRIGELYRARFLARSTKMTTAHAIATVIVERAMDMVLLLVASIIAIFIVAKRFLPSLSIPLTIVIVSVLLVCVILAFTPHFGRVLLKLMNRLLPTSWCSVAARHVRHFYHGIATMRPRQLISAMFFTVLIWWKNVLMVYLLAIAVGIEVPFLFVALVVPLITLANVLPITISGLGTTQASVLFFFGSVGALPEQSVALSILMIAVGIWLYALPGALLYALRR